MGMLKFKIEGLPTAGRLKVCHHGVARRQGGSVPPGWPVGFDLCILASNGAGGQFGGRLARPARHRLLPWHPGARRPRGFAASRPVALLPAAGAVIFLFPSCIRTVLCFRNNPFVYARRLTRLAFAHASSLPIFPTAQFKSVRYKDLTELQVRHSFFFFFPPFFFSFRLFPCAQPFHLTHLLVPIYRLRGSCCVGPSW